MSEFTVNDVSLFYEIKGNPEGKEAVAFLNGVMASTSSWSLIYPIFGKIRVLKSFFMILKVS